MVQKWVPNVVAFVAFEMIVVTEQLMTFADNSSAVVLSQTQIVVHIVVVEELVRHRTAVQSMTDSAFDLMAKSVEKQFHSFDRTVVVMALKANDWYD